MKRALLVTILVLVICAIVYAQGSAIPHPMGLDTYIQYNNGGVFGGTSYLTINDSTGAFESVGVATLADGSLLKTSAAPTTDAMIANKKYVDDTAGGGGVPGGADTQVQYNNGGAFGGDATFNFNDTTKVLDVDGLTITGTIATGLDMSGGTFATAVQNWPTNPIINIAGVRAIMLDDTLFNTSFGTGSFNNDVGQYNVGVGYRAGYNNDTTGGGVLGTDNFYFGRLCGYGIGGSNKGYRNVGIGNVAMYTMSTGHDNVAIGGESMRLNTIGHSNCALGGYSLSTNLSGTFNAAFGLNALKLNSTGDKNCAVGVSALYSILGSNNIGIGTNAGQTATGYRNIFIGDSCGWYQAGVSDKLLIDNRQRADSATEITNAILYGVMAAAPADQSLRINGLVSTHSHYPVADDTYYLGKNDDDTPFAWKGVILKDTTDGKYYRIEVISGVVTATDLTD